MPRRYLKRVALWFALRRKPPVRKDIFEDGPPNPNYFINYLRGKDGKRRFIVQDMDKDGVSGLWFEEGKQEGEPRKLSNAELRQFMASFRQNYRGNWFEHKSPFWLLARLATFQPQRHRIWDKLAQGSFNRKPLVRADRMEVLRFFLDKTIKKPGYSVSQVSLMADMYSLRYLDHPDEKEAGEYYDLVLDSLVVSGDLIKNGAAYSFHHKALATLHVYEQEEQRQREMTYQQRLLAYLTAALVFVGLLQALITWRGQL